MTVTEIEQTDEYKQWKIELSSLNKKINDLQEWNDYAEYLQSEYDYLLFNLDPRKKAS
jgi:hypothetical protein